MMILKLTSRFTVTANMMHVLKKRFKGLKAEAVATNNDGQVLSAMVTFGSDRSVLQQMFCEY